MKTFTIKTHSANPRENECFLAILTLAGSALKHDWRAVEHGLADVVVIASDEEAPNSSIWKEYSEQYTPDRLIAYTPGRQLNGAKWHLPRDPGSMPRLSEVVKVLNSVAFHLDGAEHQPSLPESFICQAEEIQPRVVPEAIQGSSDRFDPANHLAGLVQQSIERKQCMVCSMPGFPPLYLFPEDNALFTSADSKAKSFLCRADMDSCQVTIISEDKLREEITAQGISKRIRLSEFLWFSILTGSDGRLLAGHDPDEPVHLKEWPGFVRLSFYGIYQEIASYMSRELATLEEIASECETPIQNVIDFHNACESMGLLMRGEEARTLAADRIKYRNALRQVLKPHMADEGYLKLVLVGSVGAGKTTALTSLSDTPPILTEANPSDAVASRKPTTTIAMEYGEVCIAPKRKLQIYGTPGQRRFDFMGKIMCTRAWGIMILLDNTEADPLSDLDYYLTMYSEHMKFGKVGIGITHYDTHNSPAVGEYEGFLRARGFAFPVAAVDPRDIKSLVGLITEVAASREALADLEISTT